MGDFFMYIFLHKTSGFSTYKDENNYIVFINS